MYQTNNQYYLISLNHINWLLKLVTFQNASNNFFYMIDLLSRESYGKIRLIIMSKLTSHCLQSCNRRNALFITESCPHFLLLVSIPNCYDKYIIDKVQICKALHERIIHQIQS